MRRRRGRAGGAALPAPACAQPRGAPARPAAGGESQTKPGAGACREKLYTCLYISHIFSPGGVCLDSTGPRLLWGAGGWPIPAFPRVPNRQLMLNKYARRKGMENTLFVFYIPFTALTWRLFPLMSSSCLPVLTQVCSLRRAFILKLGSQ